MRNIVRLTLVASALIVLASCGGRKGADLQEGAVAPDKTLFENGMKFLGKKHFIKSRLSFQTLISTYPESEYTPTSFLSIADSYYEEGGKENLLQAEAQYKDFIIFYPTHESADNAQMRIAAINYRLMKPHDRDPTYTRKAEIELKKFLDDFPDSELAPTAEEFLRQVREELSRGVHGVGVFYHERKRYSAAANRFEEVVEEYPEFSRLDESLFHLANSLENLGRVEEATVYYSRVAREYEFSPYFDNAREKAGPSGKAGSAVGQGKGRPEPGAHEAVREGRILLPLPRPGRLGDLHRARGSLRGGAPPSGTTPDGGVRRRRIASLTGSRNRANQPENCRSRGIEIPVPPRRSPSVTLL